MEKKLSDRRMSENMSFWVKIPIFPFQKECCPIQTNKEIIWKCSALFVFPKPALLQPLVPTNNQLTHFTKVKYFMQTFFFLTTMIPSTNPCCVFKTRKKHHCSKLEKVYIFGDAEEQHGHENVCFFVHKHPFRDPKYSNWKYKLFYGFCRFPSGPYGLNDVLLPKDIRPQRNIVPCGHKGSI